MSDLKNYKIPEMFVNCDFGDTVMPDGVVLVANDEPIVLERGNIICPGDWTDERRKAFRTQIGSPS